MESKATLGATAYRIAESSLWADVSRLQKLQLDEALSISVEEAERLVNAGRYQEAEALLQNADARVRRRHTDSPSDTR